MPTNGLVVMTPTSIVSTGTGNSSSINADGSVDFTSCTTLSLNGVFTSNYDNYMVVARIFNAGNIDVIGTRLRASGTDNATSNSYKNQLLQVSSTGLTANAFLSTSGYTLYVDNDYQVNGGTIYFFGPQIASHTGVRVLNVESFAGARMTPLAFTHNQLTSYDGFTFISLNSVTFAGSLTVFGFNQ